MYSAIARNKRNTVFIIIVFLAVIGGLGYLASVVYADPWITLIVFVVATAYALIQYFAADKLAVSMAGGHEIQKADNPRLYRVVENLAITEGLPMPKVYIVNDPAPNAFATGRDPKSAAVAATSGLLDLMTDQELEAVMAHEMGHVKNYDIRVSMIVFGLVVAVGFIADMFLRVAIFGGGRSRNNNGGNPIMLVFGLVAMIIAPLIAAVVQAAISRQREYLADATGAMTTRNPDALASALAKLGEYGRPMKRQNSTMSHLWISDPNRPGLMSRMFSTHPPIPERIARLEKIGRTF
ncbi:M48 family metalloprotease [Homoserinimonas sp. OAct 916]|uniref:M48 family metalloprotease n=1 Tax=Homoserinimonas sp. OAct 916 TaxID=2211450 RepID=UPI000DBE57E6|nr:M48 family metalloprotease [Homoserinimonas sp. OAct 916]